MNPSLDGGNISVCPKCRFYEPELHIRNETSERSSNGYDDCDAVESKKKHVKFRPMVLLCEVPRHDEKNPIWFSAQEIVKIRSNYVHQVLFLEREGAIDAQGKELLRQAHGIVDSLSEKKSRKIRIDTVRAMILEEHVRQRIHHESSPEKLAAQATTISTISAKLAEVRARLLWSHLVRDYNEENWHWEVTNNVKFPRKASKNPSRVR